MGGGWSPGTYSPSLKRVCYNLLTVKVGESETLWECKLPQQGFEPRTLICNSTSQRLVQLHYRARIPIFSNPTKVGLWQWVRACPLKMKAVQLESYLISLLFSCSFFIRYFVTYYPLIQFQALLREGHANPNAVGNSGCTPLHIAAHLDHANSVAICKLLVSVHLFCVHFVLLLSVQCCTEGFFLANLI